MTVLVASFLAAAVAACRAPALAPEAWIERPEEPGPVELIGHWATHAFDDQGQPVAYWAGGMDEQAGHLTE